MEEDRTFFVMYADEMTSDDRDALNRPGWKLHENGVGITGVFSGQEMPPVKWRQVVRLRAADEEAAMRLVDASVSSLGYAASRR